MGAAVRPDELEFDCADESCLTCRPDVPSQERCG